MFLFCVFIYFIAAVRTVVAAEFSSKCRRNEQFIKRLLGEISRAKNNNKNSEKDALAQQVAVQKRARVSIQLCSSALWSATSLDQVSEIMSQTMMLTIILLETLLFMKKKNQKYDWEEEEDG